MSETELLLPYYINQGGGLSSVFAKSAQIAQFWEKSRKSMLSGGRREQAISAACGHMLHQGGGNVKGSPAPEVICVYAEEGECLARLAEEAFRLYLARVLAEDAPETAPWVRS